VSDAGFCPVCKDWPLEPADRFCGHCGALVALSGAAFHLDDRRPERPVLSVRAAGSADRAAPAPDTDEGGDLAVSVSVLEGGGRESSNPASRDIAVRRLFTPAGAPLTQESLQLMRDPATVLALRPVVGAGVLRDLGTERLAVHIGPRQPPPALAVRGGPLLSDAVRSTTAGGEIFVRLHNGGGASWIEAVRLRLDRVAGAEEDGPRLAEPQFIGAGEAVVVPAWLSAGETAAAAARPGEIAATLHVVAGGAAWSQRVKLERWEPPSATLVAAERIETMAGRRSRLAARIVNTGGVGLTVAGVEARLATSEASLEAAPWTTVGIPTAWRAPLAADAERGAAHDAELRIQMPDLASDELASLPYIQEVRVRFQDAGGDAPEAIARSVVLVKRPAPFPGRLCVDFGTTETAAAAILGLEPDAPTPGAPPQTPFVVELGSVLLSDGPAERRFIRTLVVQPEVGGLLCGEDAAALLENAIARPGSSLPAPEARIKQTFQSFKWGLGDLTDVAVAFLQHVKGLIEDHPRIAATIGPETVMFATCPTRFAEPQRAALREAFIAAGFPDPLATKWLDLAMHEVGTFIAESWSPLPYALFAEPARFATLGQTSRREVLPDLKLGETGRIVVYDVGGGSADFSVLNVTETPDGKTVTEASRGETSTTFAGLQFTALIEDCIRRWAGGRRFQIGTGLAAETALAGAAKAFQHRPGLLSSELLAGAMRSYFENWAGWPEAERAPRAIELFRNALIEGGLQLPAQRAALRGEMSAYLPLAFGAEPAETLIRLDDIPELAGAILARFADAFHDEVAQMDTSGLKSSLGGAEADKVRLVPSGRGAACPLADALILQGWGATKVCRLPPIESKSITSWGGLHICDLAFLGGGLIIDFGRLADAVFVKNGLFEPILMPWRDEAASVALIRLDKLSLNARVGAKVQIVCGRGGPDVFPIATVPLGEAARPDALSKYWVGVLRRDQAWEPLLLRADGLDEALAGAAAHG
jgi:hypothetical protein